MAKKPQLVPALAAANPALAQLQGTDIHNVLVAARVALPHLNDQDLVNVSASIARINHALAEIMKQQGGSPAPEKEAKVP